MNVSARRRRQSEPGVTAREPGMTQEVTQQQQAKQDLEAARDFFQATLDSLPAQIVVLDEHGEIMMSNRAWGAFALANGVGNVTSVGVGANYLDACDRAGEEDVALQVAAGLRAIIAGAETDFTIEYPCPGPQLERWFLMRAALYDGPGAARLVIAHDDITTRREAEADASTQAGLLDEIDASVVATDRQGLITRWNDGAERMFGWTRVQAVGRVSAELITANGARAGEAIATIRREGQWEGKLTGRRRHGSAFPMYVRSRQMIDGSGQVVGTISMMIDLTERVESERSLLAARNYLRSVTDGMGEGLCTIDPEGRLIYMNQSAEKLLGWSAAELRGRVVHDLVHVGRAEDGDCLAENCPILKASHDGVTVRVEDDVFLRKDGLSVPVAYTAAPFVSDDGIEGCAVVFEDITESKARQEMMERDVETLSWIGRIRDALAEDRFELYAQPIMDLGSGEIVQRELLLRLREPDGEIVPPFLFLPIAEQYGLIDDIDRWVIKRATEVAARVGAVELNLSARSVGHPSVVDDIERCLAQTGADPSSLVFEITETALIADESAAKAFADRLHALGCKLALDDFGTGYGGFTYLKQLPIDFLKIDIEFVRDLATNPASRHVVEAVVALAHAFGLQTVAEGVEDAQALDLVGELGVDFAQGYHIARPAPIEECARSAEQSSSSFSDAKTHNAA